MLVELPEGWRAIRLGDVACEKTLRNSGRQITKERLVGVFKEAGMVPTRERVQGESVDRCKIVSPGAFAYNPMRINIGSIARWKGREEAIVSPDYVVFEPNLNDLDGDFLDHLSTSAPWLKFVSSAGDGGVRIRIYFDHLAEFRFALPPLSEQRRIAEILSSVDEAIRATRVVIEQTRKVKQGVLERLLTKGIAPTQFRKTEFGEIPSSWQIAPIEALLGSCEPAMRSGPFGSALRKVDLAENGVPLLGIDNVHVERFETKYKRFVSLEKFYELERYSVRPNDVMITIMGTVGRSCVVPADIGLALSSKHVWTITLDQNRYLPELMCWQLNYAPWILREFARNAQGGVMAAISSSVLRSAKVPVPSIEEQQKILDVWAGFRAVLEEQKRQLSSMMTCKAAIMSDLLSGRRRAVPDMLLAAE